MTIFKVAACGYDASNPATAERLIWVKAPGIDDIDFVCLANETITEASPSDVVPYIQYFMPDDEFGLYNVLRHFARVEISNASIREYQFGEGVELCNVGRWHQTAIENELACEIQVKVNGIERKEALSFYVQFAADHNDALCVCALDEKRMPWPMLSKIEYPSFDSTSMGQCGPLEYQIAGCKLLITTAAGSPQQETTVVTLPEAFPAVVEVIACDASLESDHTDLLQNNFSDYECDEYTGDQGEVTADAAKIKILKFDNGRLGYLFLKEEPTNLTLVEDSGGKVAVNLQLEEDQVIMF